MDTILMTGTTGFLGRRVAIELLDAGYHVRALLGVPTLARTIDPRLDGVPGGVRDRAGLAAAMRRVDGLVHLDADREGTHNVLHEAERAGIGRTIGCSSDAAFGDTGGHVVDEGFLHVAAAADRERWHVHLVVCTLYGPGDPSPIGALIARHAEGRLTLLPRRRGGCTFTHVEDAARAVRLALEKGRAGAAYLVGGEPASFERFFDVLSVLTGVSAPRFAIPRWLEPLLPLLAPGVGEPIAELNAKLGRGETHFFSSFSAQRDLGCTFRPLAQGLAETLGCMGGPPIATAGGWSSTTYGPTIP
jgi:nucleoside-diphosphate-sugar epimerase